MDLEIGRDGAPLPKSDGPAGRMEAIADPASTASSGAIRLAALLPVSRSGIG
jgi:hypothetical protein